MYKYAVEGFEYRGTNIPDTYYENCFDIGLERYCSFIEGVIKNNIFTIGLFDKQSDIDKLYHSEALSTKKYNEILKKHFNIKSDEELIERFEDIDVIWQ